MSRLARFAYALVLAISPNLFGAAQTDILGTWEFTSIRYREQVKPRPNPDLILRFEFLGDGTSRLHWSRTGERGFCERKAKFTIEDGLLKQDVFWINPDNAADCSRDPDMQIGQSQTPILISADTIETELHVGDETLTYIWTRVP